MDIIGMEMEKRAKKEKQNVLKREKCEVKGCDVKFDQTIHIGGQETNLCDEHYTYYQDNIRKHI